MLPKVIPENQAQMFKFWFNGDIQDGMRYRNELYYRVQRWSSQDRPQLYHMACKLTQQGADVLVTVDGEHGSLWASLRNQKIVAAEFSAHLPLPSIDTLLAAPMRSTEPPQPSDAPASLENA